MNYVLKTVTLLLISAPLFAAEHDYQEQLEAAIVQTNAPKVSRLLKRRTRTSVKNFNHLLGWANDIVEERRMLESTPGEVTWVAAVSMLGLAAGGLGLYYYFDIHGFQTDVRATILGGKKGFFTMLGVAGLAGAYGLYKYWSGPRHRLSKAYGILFSLEDAVDALEKKKKLRSQLEKRRGKMPKEAQ